MAPQVCAGCIASVSAANCMAAPSFRGTTRSKLLWNDDDHDRDDHDYSVARTTLSAGQEMGRTRL